MNIPGERKLKKTEFVKRKRVNIQQEEPVHIRFLNAGSTLPVLIEPAGEDVNLITWAQAHRELLELEEAHPTLRTADSPTSLLTP